MYYIINRQWVLKTAGLVKLWRPKGFSWSGYDPLPDITQAENVKMVQMEMGKEYRVRAYDSDMRAYAYLKGRGCALSYKPFPVKPQP